MDKLVCINNIYLNEIFGMVETLTLYKLYECDNFFNGYALCSVIDDVGKRSSYSKDRFIPLSEWREQQMKSILDG